MSAMSTTMSAGREETQADLFAELVVQHANMALIFVGAVPHPETGQMTQDLEAAQLFIDRLEMLEAKTRGNLSAQETALLKQSLATARMAFVQAVERGAKPAPAPSSPTPPHPSGEAAAPEEASAGTAQDASPAEASGPADERKKFVKKY